MSDTGPLGLSYNEVGAVVQALAEVLIDRGHDREQIIHQINEGESHGWWSEVEFWEQVAGPAVDRLAQWLDLEPYPEDRA